ncbi:alpha/beta fold hydrolase [Stackebrandtia soli]|uniref:alpha/beta fold hydrolase n=1 Tax=Stackebrandtia soli TaxID=1892856 RepID=UPI0039ED233A
MKSVYRSPAAHRAIRDWCENRLAAWRTPHSTRVVRADAADVHVTNVGSGPVRVVLVPGTNFNAATCLDVAAVLGRRWGTAVIDVPGQPGLSSEFRPRNPHNGWYAGTLSAALDALDARDVVAIGNSMGAAIVLGCRSERIAARLLYSPAGIMRLRLDPAMAARSTAWLLAPTARSTRRMLELFTAPGSAPSKDTVDWMRLVGTHCRSTLAPSPQPVAVLRASAREPLIVASGEYDRFLPPRRLTSATARLLGASALVLSGVGHLAVEERPSDVVPLVAELLSSVAR